MLSVPTFESNPVSTVRGLALLLILTLAGCGGGGSGSGGSAGGNSDDDRVASCDDGDELACSLEAFGIDVKYTPREVVREDGSKVALPRPEEFSPLGADASGVDASESDPDTSDSGAFAAEIAVAGLRVPQQEQGSGTAGVFDMTPDVPDTGDGTDVEFTYTYELLDDLDPWAGTGSRPGLPLTASSAVDLDEDPEQELAIVYRDGEVAGDCPKLVHFDREDGVTTRHTIDDVLPCDSPRPDAFALAAGDFNGDGRDDLAVAYMSWETTPVSGMVFVLRNEGKGVFSRASSKSTWTYDVTDFADAAGGLPVVREIQIVLEAGALDWDNPDELVVVANAYNNRADRATDGRSRFYVYDQAEYRNDDDLSIRMKLAAGNRAPITEQLAASVSGEDYLTPRVADVALGDFDGDGLQEIALVGLNRIGNGCGLDADYTVVILRDLFNFTTSHEDGHQQALFEPVERIPKACWTDRRLTYVHAVAGNLDTTDTADELVVNDIVFDDVQGKKKLQRHPVQDANLKLDRGDIMFGYGDDTTGSFSWRNSAMMAADTTNDGRDNLVFYWRPESGAARPVRAYGEHDTEGWTMHYSVAASDPAGGDEATNGTPSRVQLRAVDWAPDGPVVKYEYAGYKLVFSEPQIVAAIAAPPCDAEIGQSLNWCFTTYGSSSSLTDGSTVAHGSEIDVTRYGQFGHDSTSETGGARHIAQIGGYVGQKWGTLWGASYEQTLGVARATGGLESSVLFHVTALDTYSYRIVSHPDEERVGETVIFRAPREPVLIMAPIEYYNAHLAEDSVDLAIDDRVFEHVDGRPDTYPTCGDMQDLRAENDTGVFIPQPGQEGQVSFDIGPGSGFTEVSIETASMHEEVWEEVFHGGVYLAYDGFWSVPSGFGGGFGFQLMGGEYHNSTWSQSWTESAGVSGRVTQVAEELYPEHAYRVGMFQYQQTMRRSNNKEVTFDVVNYWVTPYDEVGDSSCSQEPWDPGELNPRPGD